jgi:PEP-CTERM motif-containing protein
LKFNVFSLIGGRLMKFLLAMSVLLVLLCNDAFAETITVSSKGGIVYSNVLQGGTEYMIEVTGEYVFGDYTARADAEYFMTSASRDWSAPMEDPSDISYGLELLVNDQDIDWLGSLDGITYSDGIFSPDHTYRYFLTGSDTSISFKVWDSHYNDNSGSLFVSITEDTSSVPEPATMILLGIGLLSLAGVNRRKQ